MIKVNLVPAKEKKKRKEFLVYLGIGGMFLIVALGVTWFSLGRLQTKNSLTKQIQEVDEKSKAYKDQIAEVKDLEAKESTLEALKKTAKGISDNQRKVLLSMDQMAVNLPEGVWLKTLIQGKEKDWNKFTLGGFAFTQTALQKYLDVLGKPGGGFKEVTVNVKNIFVATGNNRQIQQFEISARMAD